LKEEITRMARRFQTPLSAWIGGVIPFIAAGLLLLLSTLGGCATITEGTSQQIAVVTSAPSASCKGIREGKALFTMPAGDLRATVDKSRHAILLTCMAPGFQTAQLTVESSVSTMGAVGVGMDFGLTDYATGALNKYPDTVTVILKPLAG
jgi:hypothetical protein